MGVGKVEETALGNRQFLIAAIADLKQMFGYRGFKVTDTMSRVQRTEGNREVIEYLEGKYLK